MIGAKWGEGSRASLLGSYRLGCLDQATGKLLDLGWVATGLTDEALADLTEMFRELILVQKDMEVEIKPAVIFEVAYEEIQKSPNYSSGYALRFPRLVAVRDDKSLEEADTLERVVSLYKVRGVGTTLPDRIERLELNRLGSVSDQYRIYCHYAAKFLAGGLTDDNKRLE